MLIDWFTVAAQAVNFLILVGLLKRFLYKPILDAVDAREKRIATELADAAAKKTEATREREDFEAKNKVFDRERGALLHTATDAANTERERLFVEARTAANGVRAAEETALRSDRTRLGNELTRLAADEVFAIARKALGDLATTSLEERLGEVFTRRLREMSADAREVLGDALRSAVEPSVVRTAFELPPTQHAVIQNALNETFSADLRIRFETARDVICGIELTANGVKVGWSLREYLAVLGQKVDGLLDAQASSATDAAAPKPAVTDAAT